MTQEEILEYNKRCAEFLGKKLISKNDFNMLGEHAYTGEHEHTNWGIIEYLKFHSDWNWIMEVVDAIEKLQYFFTHAPFLDDGDTTLSGEHFCIIQYRTTNINQPCFIDVVGCSSKKEAVVEAIHQFLIWHNENKINLI